jgi:hypothetical protein
MCGALAYRLRQESWEDVAWEMPERPVVAALMALGFAVVTIA